MRCAPLCLAALPVALFAATPARAATPRVARDPVVLAPVHAFFAKHLIAKGEEVADACVRTVGYLARLGGGMSAEAARHLAAGRVVERLVPAAA